MHIRKKSVASLALDTVARNGHSSAADALWAGVPLLTLRGHTMAQRVAPSLLTAADIVAEPARHDRSASHGSLGLTEAASMKDYEYL